MDIRVINKSGHRSGAIHTTDYQTVHGRELFALAPLLRRVGNMLVGLGNLSVSREPRRSVLPIAYGLVRDSLEGVVVSDCGDQRDYKKKCSA